MKKGNLVRLQKWTVTAMASLAFVSTANASDFGFDFNEIVGGTTVKQSDPVASSTVLLLASPSSGEYLCTGSLIAQDIVVTAAHCVAAPADKIQVVFGLKINGSDWSPTSADQVMSITGYQANPNYQGENFQGDDMGDIALIHLSGPLPSGFAPAALLPANEALNPGESTLLAGYGITSALSQSGAGTLRQVSVPILSSVGKTEIAIDESHRKGSCSGDSGGPAFINKNGTLYLWGVTSRGDRGCSQEGIYTKITAYNDWIVQAERALRK